MYGIVEVELHEFLTSAINKNNGSDLRPERFIPQELDKNLEDVGEKVRHSRRKKKQLLEEKLNPSSRQEY
jgi:hypothetical protein